MVSWAVVPVTLLLSMYNSVTSCVGNEVTYLVEKALWHQLVISMISLLHTTLTNVDDYLLGERSILDGADTRTVGYRLCEFRLESQ